jgi:hypothetical protein
MDDSVHETPMGSDRERHIFVTPDPDSIAAIEIVHRTSSDTDLALLLNSIGSVSKVETEETRRSSAMPHRFRTRYSLNAYIVLTRLKDH